MSTRVCIRRGQGEAPASAGDLGITPVCRAVPVVTGEPGGLGRPGSAGGWAHLWRPEWDELRLRFISAAAAASQSAGGVRGAAPRPQAVPVGS